MLQRSWSQLLIMLEHRVRIIMYINLASMKPGYTDLKVRVKVGAEYI